MNTDPAHPHPRQKTKGKRRRTKGGGGDPILLSFAFCLLSRGDGSVSIRGPRRPSVFERREGGSMKHASRFATVPTWGRRQFLRAAGLTVAGLTLPPSILGGCGDGGSSASSGEAAIPLTVDPNIPWWLQNGFEPVFDELSTADLRVRGRIPRQLSGLY